MFQPFDRIRTQLRRLSGALFPSDESPSPFTDDEEGNENWLDRIGYAFMFLAGAGTSIRLFWPLVRRYVSHD